MGSWHWGWRDDIEAPGSVFAMSRPGHATAVAMCPRYGAKTFEADAKFIAACAGNAEPGWRYALETTKLLLDPHNIGDRSTLVRQMERQLLTVRAVLGIIFRRVQRDAPLGTLGPVSVGALSGPLHVY